MPAYNEGAVVESAVAAVRASAERAGWRLRIIVVDDGSTDPQSVAVLDEIGRADDVELVRQPNKGRYAARSNGLSRVETDHVLLLDARVRIEPESLGRIRKAIETRGVEVWNFDVLPAVTTPDAAFWTGITKVWWRDYFRDRREVAFGAEDFDRYPKGTGAFFAPTRLLLSASRDFSSHFADAALASDDTRLLREVAARAPIHLSPEVMCHHTAKTGMRQWARQCLYRGTTFVDGYLGDRGRARGLLAGAVVVGVAGLALTVRRPRTVAGLCATGCVAAGGVTRWSGGTQREAASVGVLSPAFGVLFGAGILRGLRMAATPREH
ncbi:glycosyltransferase [Nocardioides soli]|uniref:Glycosyltransferase 2-like domain-containing protein n=1 Tax=Nocardioides soli TaxID=1036020 RepID=A0A7W4VXW0_9ACTN|nr:glycosyltransferase [Nocardioides soli]MBB3043528.1 hypothetical protein [Nocardioides soli]